MKNDLQTIFNYMLEGMMYLSNTVIIVENLKFTNQFISAEFRNIPFEVLPLAAALS